MKAKLTFYITLDEVQIVYMTGKPVDWVCERLIEGAEIVVRAIEESLV